MNTPPPSPRLQDQISPHAYKAKRRKDPDAKQFYADPSPRKPRHRISYIQGEILPEPVDGPPRLFIRGLIGGSIDIDLRGLGISLSELAFGHWVADESLRTFDIHHGDIAIIDCSHRLLKNGNLVLLEMQTGGVLRILRKRHRIWWLETADGGTKESIALTSQSLCGVVVGTLRLFTRVKPTRCNARVARPKHQVELKKCKPRAEGAILESSNGPDRLENCGRPSIKRCGVALVAEKIPAYDSVPRRRKSPR